MSLSDFLQFAQSFNGISLWLLVPLISFLRAIPVAGLVFARIPILAVACIGAESWWQVAVAIILSGTAEYAGDLLHSYKFGKFWKKHLYRMSDDKEYKKIETILKHYKKRPITGVLLISYTAFNFSFITPLVHKYDLNWKNFWIPRIIIGYINTVIFASVYFIIGKNLELLDQTLKQMAVVILVVLAVIIGISIVHSVIIAKKFIK